MCVCARARQTIVCATGRMMYILVNVIWSSRLQKTTEILLLAYGYTVQDPAFKKAVEQIRNQNTDHTDVVSAAGTLKINDMILYA